MKIGIDSYCFHRYFGEIHTTRGEADTDKRWTMFDLVEYARGVQAECLSLETCYMNGLDKGFLHELRASLDTRGMDRILAWGHPVGLQGGTSRDALRDLVAHIPAALELGCRTMRITASGGPFSPDLEKRFARDLDPVMREAVRAAEDQGVVLAIEDHGDYNADGLLRLLQRIGSPNLRVTLDTGNLLSVGDDPVEGARKLAPYVAATHIKDLVLEPGAAGAAPSYRCTPTGRGLVHIPRILGHLRAAGYDGFLCVEIHDPAASWAATPEEELVRLSLEYLRSVVGNAS